MAEERKFCTFGLANYLFGVDVREVQEVFRYQEQTRVPLAPEAVKGLINLRGQIVTAIDLRLCLDLGERAQEQQPVNVVVPTEDGAVSLLVDQIGDVVEVSDDLFEPPPETLERSIRELIHGAYKLEDRLLLVLNCESILKLEHITRSH